MAVNYNIISTGSQGNAVVINHSILIDCGVSFKVLNPFYRKFKLILLTHAHADHFNRITIRTLAKERPTLRFGCGKWLVSNLISCGVSKHNIDVYDFDNRYNYGMFQIIPLPLVHNVPNCGYKIHFVNGNKMVYATDTNNLNGISAPNYDLYMIEANHTEEEIKQRIQQKQENGEYAYEFKAIHNHLSKEKCDDFIYRNIGPGGIYVYMHCHRDTAGA